MEGSNEYTIQKVGEGIKLKMRVHSDRLITYNDVMELDKRKTVVEAADDEEKEVHEVEKRGTGGRMAAKLVAFCACSTTPA